MRPDGFPPLVSQEPMVNISAQSDETIQICWPSSVGLERGH